MGYSDLDSPNVVKLTLLSVLQGFTKAAESDERDD